MQFHKLHNKIENRIDDNPEAEKSLEKFNNSG